MEMSPRSHPALPVDLETLPEPDHPQAPGAGGSEYLFLTYTATPPISKTQHTFCRGPFQEKEGFLESGQGQNQLSPLASLQPPSLSEHACASVACGGPPSSTA